MQETRWASCTVSTRSLCRAWVPGLTRQDAGLQACRPLYTLTSAETEMRGSLDTGSARTGLRPPISAASGPRGGPTRVGDSGLHAPGRSHAGPCRMPVAWASLSLFSLAPLFRPCRLTQHPPTRIQALRGQGSSLPVVPSIREQPLAQVTLSS